MVHVCVRVVCVHVCALVSVCEIVGMCVCDMKLSGVLTARMSSQFLI